MTWNTQRLAHRRGSQRALGLHPIDLSSSRRTLLTSVHTSTPVCMLMACSPFSQIFNHIEDVQILGDCVHWCVHFCRHSKVNIHLCMGYGAVEIRSSERASSCSSIKQLIARSLSFSVLTDLDDPIVTVHQSIGEAKEQFYYERTVFLRCVANSNPPVRYSWHRGREVLTQGSDKGVEIYEPFFTQVRQRQRDVDKSDRRCNESFFFPHSLFEHIISLH